MARRDERAYPPTVCERRATLPGGFCRENPKGGGSFACARRWLSRDPSLQDVMEFSNRLSLPATDQFANAFDLVVGQLRVHWQAENPRTNALGDRQTFVADESAGTVGRLQMDGNRIMNLGADPP